MVLIHLMLHIQKYIFVEMHVIIIDSHVFCDAALNLQ